MTNFSGVGRTGLWKWLTPERYVLLLPIFAGLCVSGVLFSAVLTPLLLKVYEEEQVVRELVNKSEMLPLLREQLNEIILKQRQRQQQLDRLLSLVAGSSELNTFLAALNVIANDQRVEITTTKPGEVKLFISPKPVTDEVAPPAAGGGDPKSTGDKLLGEGLEKRSVDLSVKGPFSRVLSFLRSLESLQVFVIVTEMDVIAAPPSDEVQGKTLPTEVSLKLKVTAYGRQPKPNSKEERP